MLKTYRTLYVIAFSIVLYLTLSPGDLPVSAEDVAIPSGISVDLFIDNMGNKSLKVGTSVYTFNKKDEVQDYVITGIGTTIAETREKRQVKINHKLILGLEKVVIFSEDAAKSGLGISLDALFSNPTISDMGWMIICKGQALDLLKLKVDDYPTAADFYNGMIESSKDQNFFSDNYKLIDAYVRVDAEGRSLVLPYLELVNNHPQITGTALFQKDKMLRKINLTETKYMNFLRENNVRGLLFYEAAKGNNLSLYGKVKRKVRCKKISDKKFIFDLSLKYTGYIVNNTLSKEFLENTKELKKLENKLVQQIEKNCNDFIKKMQQEYQVDCLELGRVAAAKYGRGTGVDWNKAVSNSEIRVNLSIKINNFGRGQYTIKN